MKRNKLVEILEEQCTDFKNNIAIELEKNHDQWFENFGFPIFGITSKDYYEQVYFQSYVESYTRKMINCILKEIIDYEVIDEIQWPEFEYKGIYNGYTNTECEQEFGFEFINKDKRIGYRYSFFEINEIDALLAKGDVDSIKLIEWKNNIEVVSFEYDDKRVAVILIWDLFHELFDELPADEINDMYDLFVEYVSNAVEAVNSMIALTTLPGFTPSYIHKNRNLIISDLHEKVVKISEFHVDQPKYKKTEENSKQLIDTYDLNGYFLRKKMEYALAGTSDYAKSFLTSEYLFRYFKKNPMFDYTPIVSGYIKSIEQLLYQICVSYRNYKKIRLDMGSWTMGDYTNFIDKNEEIVRKELRIEKDIICECLKSYRVESRNHLFHRDYFYNWDRVEQIRENTIFLYVTLLGMLDDELIINTPRLLSLLNEEYDKLFYAVDKTDSNYYWVEINGKNYPNMIRENRNDGISYNWNGLIKNTIRFKKYDENHYDEIEISSKNMPSAIWATDLNGEKTYLIWKCDES